MKPILALVGRPNVGKSTLFNRIIGQRKAIVEDTPGITRDRLYEEADWNGCNFILIDTGGIDFQNITQQMESRIYQQVLLAIEEADTIIFVTDGQSGLTDEDMRCASILKKSNKPVILAVNKVDHFDDADYYDFYKLGLGDPIPVSSLHGMNTGDLLDAAVATFPQYDSDKEEDDIVRFALIGRPNVGKSSLANRLLGQERTIVSDIPGTTRDSIDSSFNYEGQKYILIDTAGMRRRGKIQETTEKYSIIRTLRAVDRSDICLLLLDATDGVTEQDKKVAGYAHEAGKGLIIVVNKWDAISKDNHTQKEFEEEIREGMAFLSYAPIIYISALTGQRTHQVMQYVRFVSEEQSKRIPTARINEVLTEAVRLNPPPTDKGKKCRMLYASQVSIKPPVIVVHCSEPDIVHFSYERYLINRFRESFGFEGTPVHIILRKA